MPRVIERPPRLEPASCRWGSRRRDTLDTDRPGHCPFGVRRRTVRRPHGPPIATSLWDERTRRDACLAQPVRAKIRESARVSTDEVEHRLELPAHHIAAVRLEVQLEGEYRSNSALQSALTSDHTTVDTASLTLELASGLTALNLCADAVMWWTGANRAPDLAYDMNSIRPRSRHRRCSGRHATGGRRERGRCARAQAAVAYHRLQAVRRRKLGAGWSGECQSG
jgi:hypothetical protein